MSDSRRLQTILALAAQGRPFPKRREARVEVRPLTELDLARLERAATKRKRKAEKRAAQAG